MFHSYLVIDTGGNPDKPRPGRQWINNIYSVHQRLCMGFPSESKMNEDKLFLKPFIPDSFTKDDSGFYSDKLEQPLSNKEKNRPDFLFRIDNQIYENQRTAVICIQSELEPNWNYAFQNAKLLLSDNFPISKAREYNPVFNIGEKYRFRILINLSKKSKKYRYEKVDTDEKKWQGKRISLNWTDDISTNEGISLRDQTITDWFSSKVQNSGLNLNKLNVVYVGWKLGWKHTKGKVHTLRFRSALLEGELIVTQKEEFLQTIRNGIGSAKAFGFGLLTIARVG